MGKGESRAGNSENCPHYFVVVADSSTTRAQKPECGGESTWGGRPRRLVNGDEMVRMRCETAFGRLRGQLARLQRQSSPAGSFIRTSRL